VYGHGQGLFVCGYRARIDDAGRGETPLLLAAGGLVSAVARVSSAIRKTNLV
jgi:hypothetical protein